MKNQLSKKVYTFIFTALLVSASANAQIVYTDVIPDSTSTGTYNLDLNNDGINDFVITQTSTTACGSIGNPATLKFIRLTTLGTNQVANSAPDVTKMALNANISTTLLNWNNGANQLMVSACHAPTGGQWANAVDGYLGLKLISGGNTYYGWARLNTSLANSFTIKDYAYNSIPNQPILAGQTTATGISPFSFEELGVRLFPNPANNHVTIALGSINKKVEVTIADITGKVIYSTTASETQKIELNTKDFAKGIYVVKIQKADLIATKELVIEK